MGASSWITIVPEEGDLEDCLHAAKRLVFARQDFVDRLGITTNPENAIATLKSFEIPPGVPPEDQEDYLLDLQEINTLDRITP